MSTYYEMLYIYVSNRLYKQLCIEAEVDGLLALSFQG